MESLKEQATKYLKVSYLNVSSLKCHYDDVRNDNFMMSSDIFSLRETWLVPGEERKFDGYTGTFASHGRGKGVAAFHKVECIQVNSTAAEKYSAIHLRNEKFDMIFLGAQVMLGASNSLILQED